jgi:serine/threonine protein kinase
MQSKPGSSDHAFDVAGPTSPQKKAKPPNSADETTAFSAGWLTSRVFESSATKNPSEPATHAKPAEACMAVERTIAGRFRIQKLLGRGGMGSVYLAHDEQLDRPIALKIPRLPDDVESAEKSVSRFLREARAAAILSHPNICPIYDVGQDGDIRFIAMGFVTGSPLTTYVTSDKPQPSRQVGLVVRKIALALAAAHQKGILHRDLKPANIMIDDRGEPIVMDFGLACRLDDDWETRLTQDGKVVGTPTYMSPEQIDGRCEVGPASDVYSLGVVMYELLVGKCPFHGSLVSVVGQVLHVEPKPVADLRPDVPSALAEICQRAMAKDRSNRFESMQEFAAALTEFLQSTTFASKPAAAKETALAPLPDLNQVDSLMCGPTIGSVNLPNPALRRKGLRAWPPAALWAIGLGAASIFVAIVAAIVIGNSKPNVADDNSSTVAAAQLRDKTQLSSAAQQAPQAAPHDQQSATPVVDETKAAASGAATDPPAATAASPASPPTTSGAQPSKVSPSPISVFQVPVLKPTSGQTAVEPKPETKSATRDVGDTSPARPLPNTNGSNQAPPPMPPTFSVGPPGSQRPGPQNGGPGGGAFAQIDSVEALENFFKQADHNHDGRLDPTELPMHIIRRAVKNGGQSVNFEELKRAFQRLGPALFAPPTAEEQRKLPSPIGGPRRGH